MDVLNRLGLNDDTAHKDFFTGSCLESQAAEQAAMLVLLLSSEKGDLSEVPLTDIQLRMRRLNDKGVMVTLDTLVEGLQELAESGFLNMQEKKFRLFLTPSPLLLDAVEPP